MEANYKNTFMLPLTDQNFRFVKTESFSSTEHPSFEEKE
jgi:hypothetical protein